MSLDFLIDVMRRDRAARFPLSAGAGQPGPADRSVEVEDRPAVALSDRLVDIRSGSPDSVYDVAGAGCPFE